MIASAVSGTPPSASAGSMRSRIPPSTAAASAPPSASSATTPAAPILSSLSMLMSACAWRSAANPQESRIPARMRLSFTRMVQPVRPSAASVAAVAEISSTSASCPASPMMSMSHCMNWR